MTRRLAIIPARGGSKRLPRKNVRDFCGRPMIGHILDAASKADLFDAIHVSTEDAEVAEVASALGFAPEFPRPAHLADDLTPLMPVLKFVTEHYRQLGQEFDQVWLLMACAPLIEAADLKAAADLFDEHGGAAAVLAVASYPAPVEWAYVQNKDGTLSAVQPGMFAVRSQDIEPKFFDAGEFVAFSSATVLASEGPGRDIGLVGYTLPRHKAVDIDDEEDWALAQAIYLGLHATPPTPEAGDRLRAIKDNITLQMDQHDVLRPLREGDVTQAYVDGLNDPEVNRFLLSPNVQRLTLESVRGFVRDNDRDENAVLFGLFIDDKHVGNVRLHDIDWGEKHAHVGIALFDKSAWGRGLGTEALRRVVCVGFEILGLTTIRAGIADENIPSQRIFQKAGFASDSKNARQGGGDGSSTWMVTRAN